MLLVSDGVNAREIVPVSPTTDRLAVRETIVKEVPNKVLKQKITRYCEFNNLDIVEWDNSNGFPVAICKRGNSGDYLDKLMAELEIDFPFIMGREDIAKAMDEVVREANIRYDNGDYSFAELKRWCTKARRIKETY